MYIYIRLSKTNVISIIIIIRRNNRVLGVCWFNDFGAHVRCYILFNSVCMYVQLWRVDERYIYTLLERTSNTHTHIQCCCELTHSISWQELPGRYTYSIAGGV